MEEFLEPKEYRVSEFGDSNPLSKDEDTPLSGIDCAINEEDIVKIEVPTSDIGVSTDDSNKFYQRALGTRDVILKEKWDISENVQGRVILIDASRVFVDCMVDVKTRKIEHRAFPKYLFSHLEELTENVPVIIKTNTKAGSIRIDVYHGAGIVDVKLFEQQTKWELLENSGLDSKLTKW